MHLKMCIDAFRLEGGNTKALLGSVIGPALTGRTTVKCMATRREAMRPRNSADITHADEKEDRVQCFETGGRACSDKLPQPNIIRYQDYLISVQPGQRHSIVQLPLGKNG